MRKTPGFTIILFLLAGPAAGQSTEDMTASLQAALQNNDRAHALDIATDLYDRSDRANDDQSAGYFSFVKAGLFEFGNNYSDAAKAYDQCTKHYGKINAHAQSIECQYKSGLAHQSDNKPGHAIDALRAAAKSLEAIGQEKSALAAQVYFTLANETMPSKLDHSRSAIKRRLATADYANKSLVALDSLGQANSSRYVWTLFTKALALEDANAFEDASETYAEAIALYKSMPELSPEVLANMQSRHSIALFGTRGKGNKNTIDVRLKSGDVVSLSINKKKSIKTPRINKNQLVDGARVRARIHLLDSGEVDQIEILESMPSEDFGVAFKNAVKTWEFQRPVEMNSEDIPPFEYSMVFYV